MITKLGYIVRVCVCVHASNTGPMIIPSLQLGCCLSAFQSILHAIRLLGGTSVRTTIPRALLPALTGARGNANRQIECTLSYKRNDRLWIQCPNSWPSPLCRDLEQVHAHKPSPRHLHTEVSCYTGSSTLSQGYSTVWGGHGCHVATLPLATQFIV